MRVTYAKMVCDIRPKKNDVHRTRLTVGGDRLIYPGNPTAPAASLIETKIMINSVLKDAAKGARFHTADIKDFFLQSILLDPKYMKIHGRYLLR